MFRLSLGDLWRGMMMAVIAPLSIAVFGVLGAVILVPDFDVFSVDFVQLLRDLTNVFIVSSYSAGSSYLIKNLLTDENQNFLGIETRS